MLAKDVKVYTTIGNMWMPLINTEEHSKSFVIFSFSVIRTISETSCIGISQGGTFCLFLFIFWIVGRLHGLPSHQS